MAKKCVMCGELAEFQEQNGSDLYCFECAQMHFGNVDSLARVDEKGKKIKNDDDEFRLKIDE